MTTLAAPRRWTTRQEVLVTAESIADYAAAVGEPTAAFGKGTTAPPMFAAVYTAPAIWRAVVATVEGRGPLIHAAQEFEWYAPVRAGDRIVTRARLVEEGGEGAYRSLRFRSLSHNDRRGLVSRGLWTILVPEGGL
jgi:acyl dehydratase